MQKVFFSDLGLTDYKTAWDHQEELLRANVEIKTAMRQALDPDTRAHEFTAGAATKHSLLFVEHPPVYTLGKSGKIENVLISEPERLQQGIAFFYTNRGGDITFHGPEQLVGYPVLDLEKFYTDIGRYLRNLEEVIILTMATYGLAGKRSTGETGVWLDPGIQGKERKICAIGVRCSRWITMHGFAFNVNTDLKYFDNIIPCGIHDKQVTSLAKELGRAVDFTEVKEKVKANFEKVFGVMLVG
ncbi:MAG: lipoyl(octanoyl) transferase LipB [Chitinophagaceae bacterium]